MRIILQTNQTPTTTETRTILVTSKKHGNKQAIVSAQDFELVSKYKWSLKKFPHVEYPRCNIWINGKRSSIYMHKLLMPGVEIVDHINRNGLDNRRENLRSATKAQNNRNTNKSKAGVTSKFKGVCFFKGSKLNPWMAYITLNYKRIYLGLFKTELDAAIAYNKAALQYFGEYAKINEL